MASKSPNRHWKTADWKESGQLKTLEKEQADLLKSFSRHPNDLEGYLIQNKTMTAEGAYRCFFETYDNLEDNRHKQRLLLKPKYFENFDNDTKRMLEEKSKVLRWVVDKVPDLRDIEDCREVVVDYRKDTLRVYKLLEDSVSIENELLKLEKKLKAEKLSDSEKQILCNRTERLLQKLDVIFAESFQIMKTEACPQVFANFSNARSYYRDLIKQYRLSKDCGNQTSLVSSTSAVDKDPNETVIDTGNGAFENAEENVEVSSRNSATQGSRKQPSIATSRSSRRLQIEQMELKNLRAEKETEQRLRKRQLELEQEREEIELRRQQEELRLQQQQQQREEELRLQQQLQQQEQELRLKKQQHEDELRLRQHGRHLENKRKKAEEDDEQRRLKLELTKGSSKTPGSVADEIESVGSKRNHERAAGWAESVAQQSFP